MKRKLLSNSAFSGGRGRRGNLRYSCGMPDQDWTYASTFSLAVESRRSPAHLRARTARSGLRRAKASSPPSKIYSEWYQHFYSLHELRTRWISWIVGLGALGFLMMVLTAYVTASINPNVAIPAILVAIGAILGIIARTRPQWIWYMADVYENMPPFPYLFLLFAFGLMLWASVLGVPSLARR